MPEDLNTVHVLSKEIEHLRAGSEGGYTPGCQNTPGQLWKRLLDSRPEKRIETLRGLLESADEGARCALEMHDTDLAQQNDQLVRLSQDDQRWNMARRLLAAFIGTLRKDQQALVACGTVADKLERFLTTGAESADNRARRILCGYRWREAGREFQCAEPVTSDGMHQGEHYAYVREGAAADEELRMKYLEEENEELRRRLGLPLNRRIA